MTLPVLLLFHAAIFYIIGIIFAYGYIDLNNKFESRRNTSGQRMGGKYRDYFIKKKNIYKSFYLFFEVYALKKY